MDLLAVASMEALLAQLNGGCVDIDLSGVTFFDSCALRTLLVARRRNSQLRVVNPSTAVLRVLDITGTQDELVDGRSS